MVLLFGRNYEEKDLKGLEISQDWVDNELARVLRAWLTLKKELTETQDSLKRNAREAKERGRSGAYRSYRDSCISYSNILGMMKKLEAKYD